ncbi:DUF2846 domain-containing protein [Bordetella flabilis]|uniref:DUF2846 domain-containing protein n=1 Tax=Bordetella flabilis TaxID=463014 RepID=UPI001E5ED13C|nr:DUF2846 domain-containing protein [Bordetella flabilis]
MGKALKKDVYLDGTCIGETLGRVFFYTQVEGDCTYKFSTESGFSLMTESWTSMWVRTILCGNS